MRQKLKRILAVISESGDFLIGSEKLATASKLSLISYKPHFVM